MMIDKILIFILFLGPLIFFHELGHFLFARLFGVRVETFSLGFGPKIFRFVRGETEYVISIIPLGGYVKMFGDDPFGKDQIEESERKFAFNYKGKWARFWIVFAGPLANFILAYFIFFSLLMMGEKVPQAQFGVLPKDSFFSEKGVQEGDVIKKLNGQEILGITDLSIEEGELVKSIAVSRGGQIHEVSLNIPFKQFMDEYFKYLPKLRIPVVVDKRGNRFGASRSKGNVSAEESLEGLADTPMEKLYLYKFKDDGEIKSENKSYVGLDMGDEKMLSLSANDHGLGFYNKLTQEGYYPFDLRVGNVVKDSPADRARIKEGDLLVSINKRPISSFDELRYILQKSKSGEEVTIQFFRHTILESVVIVPELEEQGDGKVQRIGVYSAGEFLPVKYIESPGRGFIESVTMAFHRTVESVVKTVVGFKKLITQEVSFKSIGGPLAIGKVASDSFNISLSYFFKLMAFISINLGIINLFPIPVLDGGHIFFLGLELINGGPLSPRKLELAQQFGVSLLFLLIFAALFNDVTRLFSH